GVEDAAAGGAELTGGAGANLVLDFVVEGDTPQQAVSLLGQGGTYSIVGYGAQLGVATMELTLKEATIVSTMVGNYADLSELMALVVSDRVKLETKRYALEDAVAALDDLDNGRIRGRAVLPPAPRSCPLTDRSLPWPVPPGAGHGCGMSADGRRRCETGALRRSKILSNYP